MTLKEKIQDMIHTAEEQIAWYDNRRKEIEREGSARHHYNAIMREVHTLRYNWVFLKQRLEELVKEG